MRGLLVLGLLLAAAPVAAADSGERWLSHVRELADDKYEGRLTGTPGYDRAAAWLVGQFQALGLVPAGTDGFLQPVPLLEQRLDLAQSQVVLAGPAGERPLALGDELLLGARVPQLASFDAPLVFLGNGLHLPEAGHDDFAGMDLKGAIVVTLAGGPKRLPGALKAHGRSADFWPALQRAGAIGVISIANPKSMDVPWSRQKLFATTPGMRLANPALNDAGQGFFTAAIDPARAEQLFSASGRSFAQLLAIADSGGPLPRFALNQRVRGTVAATDRPFTSPNVVALLPGRDKRLRQEFVVVTAHLDHIGIDQPVNGDRIYNGAMDNASGVATLLETARVLKRKPPKRSVLFLAVTGEERGLLGSRWFANRPTVPAPALAANINMDMFLPIWPFTHVLVHGADESTLGPVALAAAAAAGVQQMPDPEPDRNMFVRSDQYSFVRAGIPALSAKFVAVTPEQFAQQKAWLSAHYHAPSDDMAQPINPGHAAAFNAYLTRLVTLVAAMPERPVWNPDSFFARFAAPAPTEVATPTGR